MCYFVTAARTTVELECAASLQAQPLGTLCTALEACMLASAFRHKLKADDMLAMTFESIFISYQTVARRLRQTIRCDINQAWGAFNTLLDMRVLVADKK